MKKYIISEEQLNNIFTVFENVYSDDETEDFKRGTDICFKTIKDAFFKYDITKLQEYKEPEQEPKFKEGDVVYYAYAASNVHKGVITEVQPLQVNISYFGGNYPVSEDRLFKTPDEAFDYFNYLRGGK